MAHILFYIPQSKPGRKHYSAFHRGPAQIAAVLKQHGHSASLRLPFTIQAEEAAADIQRSGADYVFVSLASAQAPLLRPIAKGASEAATPLLAGGPHPTFLPEETLKMPGVTAIVRGEGEEAALAFANGGTAASGLCFHRDARGTENETNTFGACADPAKLPFPDRGMFASCPEYIPEQTIMGLELAGTRGCPYSCTYCSNAAYRTVYGNSWLRRVPVDYVIAEARHAISFTPEARIAGFHDDIFTYDAQWLAEFAQRWPKEAGMPFWVNAHPALLDKERVELLARAGCVRVHMGVETGDPVLRHKVLGRFIDDAVILDAARELHRAEIKVVPFVMLGIPGETDESFQLTRSLLAQLKPHWVIQSFFQPLPGTELGEHCKEEAEPLSWEEILCESFYLPPTRSWSVHLTPARLSEMAKALMQK